MHALVLLLWRLMSLVHVLVSSLRVLAWPALPGPLVWRRPVGCHMVEHLAHSMLMMLLVGGMQMGRTMVKKMMVTMQPSCS